VPITYANFRRPDLAQLCCGSSSQPDFNAMQAAPVHPWQPTQAPLKSRKDTVFWDLELSGFGIRAFEAGPPMATCRVRPSAWPQLEAEEGPEGG